jgi:polysaccharide biosynthesis protein PslH
VRILFATTVLPADRRSGGEAVSQAVVVALRAAGHDVAVLGYARPGDEPRADEACAGRRPIETSSARLRAVAWMARALVTGDPYTSAKYRSRSYRRLGGELATGADVVIVDHAQAYAALGGVDKPLVAIAHNAEARLYAELAKHGRMRWINARESRLIGQLEAAVFQRATQVWTLTPADAAYARELSARAQVRALEVPSAVRPAERPAEYDVALIGRWSWRPNAQGLAWFYDRVMPHMPADLAVHVAGAAAAEHAGVTVCGVVPDANDFLSRARVVAVPATAGSGVQVKTLDAIAAGLPVVATKRAVRGLGDLPESVSVTDDPATFASELQRLATQRERLRPAGIAWSQDRARRFQASVEGWIGELEPAGVSLAWSA